MSTKYEDNFGFYCIDDDLDELAFFRYIKSQSKPKSVRALQAESSLAGAHQNMRNVFASS
jgi:hypothetical protein